MAINVRSEEYGVPSFYYFSLVRKADGKEVYTSPAYRVGGKSFGDLDYQKIRQTLNYYFQRVNGGIMQQLESPKLTPEQKNDLRLLEVKDYQVKFKKFMPIGMAERVYWIREASEYCPGFGAV